MENYYEQFISQNPHEMLGFANSPMSRDFNAETSSEKEKNFAR